MPARRFPWIELADVQKPIGTVCLLRRTRVVLLFFKVNTSVDDVNLGSVLAANSLKTYCRLRLDEGRGRA